VAVANENWSEGKLVSAAKGVPGSSTDCTGWDRPPSAWIVVHASYSPTTPKAVVAEHALAILQKLQALAPDLGLKYDEKRSHEPPGKREVTIAISPTVVVADLICRLEALIPNLRKAVLKVPIIGVGVRWDGEPLTA
jgi:hypothetical protein